MILIWGFRVAKDFDLGIEADTHERERELEKEKKYIIDGEEAGLVF